MKIGDNLYTADLLVNRLNKNVNNQSLIGTSPTDNSSLFVNVLTQYLKQQEGQSTLQPSQITSFIPDYLTASAPSVSNQNWQLSTQNSLRYQPVNPDQLNKGLEGKLAGMGETFVRAGQQYDMNPALLAAIAQHESANGKSLAAYEKNNIAGMMGQNGLKSYASIQDSIMDMAQNLSRNYLGEGLSSIAEIGAKYAPIGAENDPTGLNNYWVKGVTRYFNQLLA